MKLRHITITRKAREDNAHRQESRTSYETDVCSCGETYYVWFGTIHDWH